MINEYPHQPPEFDTSEERQEMINRWLETGFSEQSVALYGTSTQALQTFIEQGFLTPHPNTSSKKGVPIYYTIPITQNLTNIEPPQPKLYEQIKRRHADNYERSLSSFDDEERQKKIVSSYAFRQAMSAFWQKQLSRYGITEMIDVSDTLQIASEVVPNFASYHEAAYRAGYHWDGPYSDPNLELVAKIKTLVDRETLKTLALRAVQRRGILLCFGPDLFNHATPLPRFREDDDELVFQSKDPLPLSVISGIIVLTEEEKAELET